METRIVRTIKGLEELEQQLLRSSGFVFDLETSDFKAPAGHILCIGFCWGEEDSQAVAPLFGQHLEEELGYKDETICLLRSIFSSSVKKIGQNLDFDVRFLWDSVKIEVNGVYFDTMLAHHLLDENSPHSLEFLANKYLGTPLGRKDAVYEYLPNRMASYSLVPNEVLWEHCARDIWQTYCIFKLLEKELFVQPRLQKLFFGQVMPLSQALFKMERRGVLLDKGRVSTLRNELVKHIEELQVDVYKASEVEFNMRSPKQLREILFDKFKLPIVSRTPSGAPATNEKALILMRDQILSKSLEQDLSEVQSRSLSVLNGILQLRTEQKLLSTYLEGLEKQVDEDGRLHPNYLISGTATGRLACRQPSLQNIPQESKVRNMIVVPEGYKFIEADYNQMELRVLAYYAQDENMLSIFRAGDVDIHTQVAMQIFGVSEEEAKDPKYRNVAKNISFGLNYGRGAYSLALQLGISGKEAQKYIDAYFKRFPKVKAFMDRTREKVLAGEVLENIFGRQRRLLIPGRGYTEKEIGRAIRQGFNFFPQATAGDILNRVTILLTREFAPLQNSYLIMSLHDALFFECIDTEVPVVVDAIHRIMEEKVSKKFGLPFKVAIKVTERWGEEISDDNRVG